MTKIADDLIAGERYEISQLEILMDEIDWEVVRLPDFYHVNLIKFANKLGLKGRKIKEIHKIRENFAIGRIYIDFICEDCND